MPFRIPDCRRGTTDEKISRCRRSVNAGVVGGKMLHLVEAMLGRIGIRDVAEMPLAREVGGVAVLLEEFGDGRRFLAEIVLVAGGDHDGERRADRDAAGDEGGAARRTARLAVPIGERRALLGHAVDVRRGMAESRSSTVSAEIAPAGIIGHQHDDVGPLVLCLRVDGNRKREQCRHGYASNQNGNCSRITRRLGRWRSKRRSLDRTHWLPPDCGF